jgi:serine/threonine protein kinase
VSTTPASNDASSSKDSASQQGDDGKRVVGAAHVVVGGRVGRLGRGERGGGAERRAHDQSATDTVLLHEALGKGGSASVYRASAAGFSFACKVYHAEELSDAERAAAERDVAMMEAMAHTNVLRTLGHKYARLGRLLLYVELAGGTLADAIKAKREAAERRRAALRRSTFCARSSRWSPLSSTCTIEPQPIVHRDVKSENVFVACSAGSQLDAIGALHLKLGDFDSARYLSAPSAPTAIAARCGASSCARRRSGAPCASR